jgi:hypothetical protein
MFKKYTRGGWSLFFTIGLLVTSPVFLSAQTAADLQTVLESSAVTCSQAARFVISSTGETLSGRDAYFQQAVEKGWLPQGTNPDDSITLGRLSLLIMQAFEIKGGLMYAIAPVPRHAFRVMVSRSFIQGPADPVMKVNGERFMQILGKVLSAYGGET